MPKALDYRNFMEFSRLQDDIRIDYQTKLLPHDHRSIDMKKKKKVKFGKMFYHKEIHKVFCFFFLFINN